MAENWTLEQAEAVTNRVEAEKRDPSLVQAHYARLKAPPAAVGGVRAAGALANQHSKLQPNMSVQAAGVAKHGDRLPRARGRVHIPGQMNKLESRYADHLAARKLVGQISWWAFEALKLRLAKNTTYTPDFVVMLADRTIEMHECKGFWEEDARIKIKVAAEMFPMFRFVALQAIPREQGGGWKEEVFG